MILGEERDPVLPIKGRGIGQEKKPSRRWPFKIQNRLTVGRMLFYFSWDDSLLNVGFDFTEYFFMSLYGDMECVEKAFGCVKIEHDSL